MTPNFKKKLNNKLYFYVKGKVLTPYVFLYTLLSFLVLSPIEASRQLVGFDVVSHIYFLITYTM